MFYSPRHRNIVVIVKLSLPAKNEIHSTDATGTAVVIRMATRRRLDAAYGFAVRQGRMTPMSNQMNYGLRLVTIAASLLALAPVKADEHMKCKDLFDIDSGSEWRHSEDSFIHGYVSGAGGRWQEGTAIYKELIDVCRKSPDRNLVDTEFSLLDTWKDTRR